MKILHLTFHIGTANAIKSILEDIPGIELETKIVTSGKECFHYNMTAERANENWELWMDWYNTFDAIITTDTALLARPLLRKYKGKLIVQITNRFDYWDSKGSPNKIDDEYYDLMKLSSREDYFIANNEFDKFYAEKKGLFIEDVIKSTSKPLYNNNKTEIYYIPLYHNDNLFELYESIKENGINVLSGRYKDENELSTYKAIIHIPYTWNSIFLWDALAVGAPFIVPSEKLILQMSNKKGFWFQNVNYLKDKINLCEFYREENSKFVKHFDYGGEIEEIKINHEEIYREAERLFNLNREKWINILNS